MQETKKIAVVLAGAFSKGGFEAGALAELVKYPVDIRSIVATSSGALNGTVLAAALHGARDQRALERELDGLCSTWSQTRGGQVFRVSPGDILGARGISDQSGLLKLLRDSVKVRERAGGRSPFNLTIVAAPLAGVATPEGFTFEWQGRFDNGSFTTKEALERVFQAAAASASFPGAFAPSHVEGVGPCIDGGAVNNTPIKYALEGCDADTVVLVTSTPSGCALGEEAASRLGGVSLISRLAEILVNERLYRDLREAQQVNAAIAAMEADPSLAPHLPRILDCLGWAGRRRLTLRCIRPEVEMPGDFLSSAFDRELRARHVAEGRKRAREVLGS